MSKDPLLIVVLAAGRGVRMASSTPKVLQPIAGRSMLAHVLATLSAAAHAPMAVVIAPEMEAVRAEAKRVAPSIEVFEQPNPAGTADALLAARPLLARHRGDVLVVFADTPLSEPQTIPR